MNSIDFVQFVYDNNAKNGHPADVFKDPLAIPTLRLVQLARVLHVGRETFKRLSDPKNFGDENAVLAMEAADKLIDDALDLVLQELPQELTT